MNVKQIRARAKRLEDLSTGLAREDLNCRKGPMPLMHAEVSLYLNAIFMTRQAIEEAKNTLAKACERLESRS